MARKKKACCGSCAHGGPCSSNMLGTGARSGSTSAPPKPTSAKRKSKKRAPMVVRGRVV